MHIEKLLPYRVRAFELAVGITANSLIDWPFNYLLYPYVIYRYGILWGGVIMMLVSLLACLLTLKFYDWSKRDWLGIEAIKSLKDYRGDNKAGRISAWFLRRSEPVAFLFLTVWYDPFITVAYLRHGSFSRMTGRDWWIFYSSLILCNVYWTLACYMGITLVEWAWRSAKILLQ